MSGRTEAQASALEDEIRHSIEAYGREDRRTVALLLFRFFREAQDRGLIRGLGLARGDLSKPNPRQTRGYDAVFTKDLIQKVRAQMGGRAQFEAKHLARFVQRNHRHFTLPREVVGPLYRALPETARFNRDPEAAEMRSLWNRIMVGREERHPMLLRMTAASMQNRPLSGAKSLYLGDYLLFRMDAPQRVGLGFFRFLELPEGGVRSFGLRFQAPADISSRGWLIVQNNQYLAAGYIVHRTQQSPFYEIDGGFSMLTLAGAASHPLVRLEADGRAAVAPAAHFQANNQSPAGFSRGVLIRLRGCEGRGPQAHMEDATLNREAAALQRHLNAALVSSLAPMQANAVLQQATGWADGAFFSAGADQFGRNPRLGLLENFAVFQDAGGSGIEPLAPLGVLDGPIPKPRKGALSGARLAIDMAHLHEAMKPRRVVNPFAQVRRGGRR